METTKKPQISRTASSMNRDALVKEASQPKILMGMMRWISNWWIGSGIPGPAVPAFGVATLSSSVLVVRHAVTKAATRACHEFLLHPLVAPQHVEDASCKPQQEEEQEQPGLAAEPPVQTPADATSDHDCGHHFRGQTHAIGHAAATYFGVEIGMRIGIPLRLDPAEPVTELGNPILERSRLLGAHLASARTSTIRWIWHEDHVLGGRGPDSPRGLSKRGHLKAAVPASVKNMAAATPRTRPRRRRLAPRCDNWTLLRTGTARSERPPRRRDGQAWPAQAVPNPAAFCKSPPARRRSVRLGCRSPRLQRCWGGHCCWRH